MFYATIAALHLLTCLWTFRLARYLALKLVHFYTDRSLSTMSLCLFGELFKTLEVC